MPIEQTNLARLRTAWNLTQSELAERSGINVRLIQCYEQRYKDINKAAAVTVYRLAQALKCTVEELLELE